MSIKEYTKIGGDFLEPFDLETISALLYTKDIIGAVLRIHFCFEEFLDLWCDKVTYCEDFFDFSKIKKVGRVSFRMKIAISQKLGLPSELVDVFKKFSDLRNDFAHEVNTKISDQQFDDIRHLIDKIPSYGERTIPKMNHPSWKPQFDDRILFWSMPDISKTDKLLLIYFTFSMKLISIFTKEFAEKGIPFSYSD